MYLFSDGYLKHVRKLGERRFNTYCTVTHSHSIASTIGLAPLSRLFGNPHIFAEHLQF